MNEQIERFLSTLDRSPRTIETYRWALSYYFDEVGNELSDDSYEKFLIAIKGKSSSTRSVLRSAVMGLYDFYEIGNSSKRARLNKHYSNREQPEIVQIKRKPIEKVIEYCSRSDGDVSWLRDRTFILMLADGGFRISELVSLKRGDVDWENQRVYVRGKGNKPAVVRLSIRSVNALELYLRTRKDSDGRQLSSLPVFIQHGNTNKIKKMTSDGMRKAVKGRIAEAGIDPSEIRIHDFRHYFVTITVLTTGSLKIAKELARHKSTKTTDRYAHLENKELDKAYNDVFNKGESNETNRTYP